MSPQIEKPLKESSVFYAQHGAHVFPLAKNSKIPLKGTQGLNSASNDVSFIKRAWTDEFNIGLNCGKSGLICLDLDVRADFNGITNFEDFRAGRFMPPTMQVKTRSGGQHLYFKADDLLIKSGVNVLGQGIDIKAQGGYTILPPSYVAADEKGNGGYYEFIQTLPPAPLPAWLQEELLSIQKPKTPSDILKNQPILDLLPVHDFYYSEQNLERLSKATIVRCQKIDISNESDWINLLFEYRSLVYLCNWDNEITWKLFDQVCEKCKNYDYEKNRARWERNDFKAEGRTYKSLLDELKPKDPLSEPIIQLIVNKRRFHPLTINQLQSQSAPKWLIKSILPQTGIASIYGASGSGKTFLTLDILLAIARGINWFGFKIPEPKAVVYLALEGGAGITSRISAYLKHHNIIAPDNFYIIKENFSILNETDGLLESIVALNPSIVCIDTLAQSAAGIDENNGKDIGIVLQNAKIISGAIKGLCLFVHHTGKDASKGLRGHSSLIAALDTAIEVNIGSATKPRNWGISKSKDASSDISRAFKLKLIDLGFDCDGEELNSCVIEPDLTAVFSPKQSIPLTGKNQIIANEALKNFLPTSKEKAIEEVATKISGANSRSRATEAVNALIEKGVVFVDIKAPNHLLFKGSDENDE